jgi:hypothetical protein
MPESNLDERVRDDAHLRRPTGVAKQSGENWRTTLDAVTGPSLAGDFRVQ